MNKILVHVSLPETDTTATFRNFWEIAREGWPLAKVPPGRTDQQRNYALEILKASKGTHLVILDHDHFHSADIVHKLVSHISLEPSRLVVAGLNFSRHDRSPVATIMKNGNDQPTNLHPSEVQDMSQLIDVYSTGAAAMIISREIPDYIPGPWFAYAYPFHSNGQIIHPGTDYFFSQLMRANKIKMWVDMRLTSPHLIAETIPEIIN